jgi:hypothetical protein
MNATTQSLDRLQRDLTEIAKEPVEVEQITSSIYAFGSELAMLRLFAKYNANGAIHNAKVRFGYSENMKSFFFAIDL